MIAASHLTKSFGRVKALDDFSVTMARGQSVLLIGPNGSGKTTFIKCVLGLVIPEKGGLTLNGESLLGNPALRRLIGYMPQIGKFPDHLKVGQIIEMMREIRRGTHERTDEDLIEAFGIGKIAHNAHRAISGVTALKVPACLRFLSDPEIPSLDETTAGIDPLAAEILKEKVRAMREMDKLVLLTSHILSDLDEITSDVMHLIEGKLQFYRPIHELMEEHGETKLSRVVARIMRESTNPP